MNITHSQALLVAETLTMGEADEIVARFLDLYQQEPERISIQGPAITVGRHPVVRIDLLAPEPVYSLRHNAVQIERQGERLWVRPAEGQWERLVLEHHLSHARPSSQEAALEAAQLDERTRAHVLSLLDEISTGSEHVYDVTQVQQDETGVRCVLLFFEGGGRRVCCSGPAPPTSTSAPSRAGSRRTRREASLTSSPCALPVTLFATCPRRRVKRARTHTTTTGQGCMPLAFFVTDKELLLCTSTPSAFRAA